MAVKNVSNPVTSPVVNSRKTEANGSAKASKAIDPSILTTPKSSDAQKNPLGVDVAVSSQAKSRASEQKKALDIALKTPDVREDRVAQLKSKIESGEYKPDSEKIADGMLREAIMEHLAQEGDR